MLRRAVGLAGLPWRQIDAGTPAEQPARARRWLAAAWPGARQAMLTTDAVRRIGCYREAQVHFDLYGRLLELACPGEAGIVHWAYPMPVMIKGWQNIYTIHDAIPLTHPTLTPISRRRHQALLKAVSSRASALVTVSEAARSEIAAALSINAAMITNLGAGAEVPPDAARKQLPLNLRRDGFYLFCGSIEPRKNLERVVAAHQHSGTDLPLVLAGPAGWQAERIRKAIEGRPQVICLGYVERELLFALIAQARALLFPSLAEGFGLPIVEAMALGTPVLTSDSGSLAETAGRAALLVDPYDEPAIANAIRSLDTDGALRGDLSERGLRRAQDFALAAFAQRLKAFYCAAAAG